MKHKGTPIPGYPDPAHEAIRKYTCERCIDFGKEDGLCHSHDPEGCGIFRYLPELIQIANTLHEVKLDNYIRAVREKICFKCKNADQAGENCQVREHAECNLNNYLPLVIDALETLGPK